MKQTGSVFIGKNNNASALEDRETTYKYSTETLTKIRSYNDKPIKPPGGKSGVSALDWFFEFKYFLGLTGNHDRKQLRKRTLTIGIITGFAVLCQLAMLAYMNAENQRFNALLKKDMQTAGKTWTTPTTDKRAEPAPLPAAESGADAAPAAGVPTSTALEGDDVSVDDNFTEQDNQPPQTPPAAGASPDANTTVAGFEKREIKTVRRPQAQIVPAGGDYVRPEEYAKYYLETRKLAAAQAGSAAANVATVKAAGQ